MRRVTRPAAVFLVALLGATALRSAETTEVYRQQVERHRAEREERLRGPDGWLTLVGLFWLSEGDNTFGAGPDNDLVFPPPAPALAGKFVFDGTRTRLVVQPGVTITLDGEALQERELTDDSEGSPDVLHLGRLAFHLIRRGTRTAVRVKDPESPTRTGFPGLTFYPIDAAYRVQAHLRRYDTPRKVSVATVTGEDATMLTMGIVEFSLLGEDRQLEALVNGPTDSELFLIFKDPTNGKETYGAGRYLYAPVEKDRVLVDFNLAYNPPCAFTPFATCPLPPPGNHLGVPVRAGEKFERHR